MSVSAEYHMSRAEAWRAAVVPRHWILLLALIVGLVFAETFAFTRVTEHVITQIVMLVLGFVVAPTLFRAEGFKSFAVPTTVTLTDTELTVVRPGETTVTTWSSTGSFWIGRHACVVRRSWRTVAIIPLRAFDADQRAAIDLLANQVQEDIRQR